MCKEGGCGSCMVAATIVHPVTRETQIKAVNSCLVPILSCHGWAITTVEGVGNKLKGYHPIQKRLAVYNGTQCGYCSPGFVMSMYSLYEKNQGELTMKQIENSFGSNLCRCTGYRPICDAFKSFANDRDPSQYNIQDIEDMSSVSLCSKTGNVCTKTCDDCSEEGDFCLIDAEMPLEYEVLEEKSLQLKLGNTKWFKVYKVSEIFNIFRTEGIDSYMLVAGNTGQGIIEFKERVKNMSRIMIDVTSVTELRKYSMESNLVLGANMPLTEVIELFQNISQTNELFYYTLQMANHLQLVAHIPVRNIGTMAGNLIMKHKYPDFTSDVFLLLETVGATLKIVTLQGTTLNVTLPEFMNLDMKGKVIVNINLPPLSSNYEFQSYKIMRRAQNDHAMVNAGFLFKLDNNTVRRARIVYSGITKKFIHASATENMLIGKNIFKDSVLQAAIRSLSNEINPEDNPPEPSPEFRKKLALGLFYKCILHISPRESLNPRYITGGQEFDRPVSSGKQVYDTRKEEWPLTRPMPKLEALMQCTGEAEYGVDTINMPNEVYATFVLSTQHDGEIDKIDGKEALAIKGVVALLTAKDIPGRNVFTPTLQPFSPIEEILLCDGPILFYGQPVAIIVADSEKLANTAALKVKVTYKNTGKNSPYVTIQDVLKDPNAKSRINFFGKTEAKSKGDNIAKVIKGSFEIGAQFHFTMETQSCICIPIEGGMDVIASTQWMDYTQIAVAQILNIPENNVNVKVRRIGGGYGSKLTRSLQVITACAVVAQNLQRPARFVESIETNMKTNGKRLPCSNEYEIGVDSNGKIQYLNNTFYEDKGSSPNEAGIVGLALERFKNWYDDSTWNNTGSFIISNTPSNTYFRAPGGTEAIAMIENIMDHIALELGKDPVEVRLANIKNNETVLPELIDALKESSNFVERQHNIKNFNSENRWKKKGISTVGMAYPIEYYGTMGAFVSIFHQDATVAVSHGGIEMGQGINTKVLQVCAYTLGIPLEMVSIKPSENFITPNCGFSGASITSEQCAYGTLKACETLLERMKPIKLANPNATWKELVALAYSAGVNLSANYFVSIPELTSYLSYGVTIVEVEVDVLTGKHYILRVDIIQDTGESMSPEIDVGQVEGAYIQGLGYWITEKIVHDSKTGELLTKRTWDYKIPGIKDIPVDFRVQFRPNAPNPAGVLRSKATGEPAMTMAYGVVPAVRQAIASVRVDNGLPADTWWNMELPLTPESVLMAMKTGVENFKLL